MHAVADFAHVLLVDLSLHVGLARRHHEEHGVVEDEIAVGRTDRRDDAVHGRANLRLAQLLLQAGNRALEDIHAALQVHALGLHRRGQPRHLTTRFLQICSGDGIRFQGQQTIQRVRRRAQQLR